MAGPRIVPVGGISVRASIELVCVEGSNEAQPLRLSFRASFSFPTRESTVASKTRGALSQQPLHAIPAGPPLKPSTTRLTGEEIPIKTGRSMLLAASIVFLALAIRDLLLGPRIAATIVPNVSPLVVYFKLTNAPGMCGTQPPQPQARRGN
jgi:hypothetical protein